MRRIAWKRMGLPRFPTVEQISELKKASQTSKLDADDLTLTIPPMGWR